MTDPVTRALDDLRRRWVPDSRIGVFEIVASGTRLAGSTTSREALVELRRLGATAGLGVAVTLLPDDSVDDRSMAVTTAAVAPMMDRPAISAMRVNESLHGEPLALLERREEWLHVRGTDGYLTWIHAGYVSLGGTDWLEDWLERATARSLGAELEHQGQRRRLPIGARLALRRDRQVETADGQLAQVHAGTVRQERALHDEARLIAAPELALRWFGGAPYQWGGRTEWGVDCSGLVQAIYAARGIALPRDSDQQSGVGQLVPLTSDGAGYQVGDLLFFAEERRIGHVALWAGAGRIVHATLARGGVVREELLGDTPRLARLRDHLVAVRRVEAKPTR